MCCLSEASSHFVVFVCVNPDRKPSRKMKRRPSTGSGTDRDAWFILRGATDARAVRPYCAQLALKFND